MRISTHHFLAGLLLSCAPLLAQTSGVDLSAIDKSGNPCQNFYQYACGGWMKANPIPGAYSRWAQFNKLEEQNRTTLHNILENAAKDPSKGSGIDREIGTFYASCMNESHINDLGTKPLKPELERIRNLRGPADLPTEVARLHNQGINVFFGFGAAPDFDNSRNEIADLNQGGLGLPERDYYFRKDPKSEETRQKYVEHVAKMFELLGDNADLAGTKARAVMTLESNLAAASLGNVERRDPKKQYHPTTVDQFAGTMTNFDFRSYLAGIEAPPIPKLNVSEPQFFAKLNELLVSTPFNDIKSYLTWQYVHGFAPELSKPFVDENFNFYTQYLRGSKELLPRWERCVNATDANLGEALGQKYVDVAFAGKSKEQTQQLVVAIEQQMERDIKSLEWMSEETKQQALLKLRGVTNKIGYPERWRDYSSIVLKKDDYLGNVARAREFEQRRDLAKIGKPVDRLEFHMTPPTVNAYYNPQENNINFPAGILQAPMYKSSADMAFNYGSIGSVVGHELTHGFDDHGRQFDADENLRDWWTPNDDAEFKKRAECITNEYSQFSPIEGIKLNGQLTLGENGADNAGVRLAYMALMDAIAKGQVNSNTLDGFTPQQRFFLGFAQDWCQNIREAEARARVYIDPHSPGEFRVNGVVQNMPEFEQAFGCRAGQPMVSQNACRVW